MALVNVPVRCIHLMLPVLALALDLPALSSGCELRRQQVAPDAPVTENATAPTTIEIVCERRGKTMPRRGASKEDTEHYDLVDRSVFWVVEKTRYSTPDDLIVALSKLEKKRPRPELKMVADPEIRWQDIVFLLERLAILGFETVRFPGEWTVHPYSVGLEPRPSTTNLAIVGPALVTECFVPNDRKFAAQLLLDQKGRITLEGTVLFDPATDHDRKRMQNAIAELGSRAKECGEVQEVDFETRTVPVATSRVIICADRWAKWDHVYLLMKDLTEADPSFASFDIMTFAPPDQKAHQVTTGGDAQEPAPK